MKMWRISMMVHDTSKRFKIYDLIWLLIYDIDIQKLSTSFQRGCPSSKEFELNKKNQIEMKLMTWNWPQQRRHIRNDNQMNELQSWHKSSFTLNWFMSKLRPGILKINCNTLSNSCVTRHLKGWFIWVRCLKQLYS